MAYSETCNWPTVQTFVAWVNSESVRDIPVPRFSSYVLAKGAQANRTELEEIAKHHLIPFSDSPDSRITPCYGEEELFVSERRSQSYKNNSTEAVQMFASLLHKQWVCEEPTIPDGREIRTYINISAAMDHVQEAWSLWYRNFQFRNYILMIYQSLKDLGVRSISVPSFKARIPSPRAGPTPSVTTDRHLFEGPAPELVDFQDATVQLIHRESLTRSSHKDVANIVERLRQKAASESERRYAQDLDESIQALEKLEPAAIIKPPPDKSLESFLQEHFDQCQSHLGKVFKSLIGAARNGKSTIEPELLIAPRISPKFFLRQLSRKRWDLLPRAWRGAIVSYSVALTGVQRAKRMLAFVGGEDKRAFLRELVRL
ncbi:hypothetical protein HIM_10076 [Hirsutella minnesotensis 3608]|uniref:Uncharacterized protein n=1 Tax=Hirsutella minnesotensis 3608 TaxID=1043627 RepID=A0A0F7ZXD5_9HYPO|nr:hypothetical protein HIM_10076 [Hirsutella minnesotensis 3608]